jgi:DNA-directed RNA polymerase subunit RPC12/RpoP
MDSLTTQLLHGDLDISCPSCGFGMWVRVSEVVAECAVRCPACRTRIWLRDDRGQMHNLGSVVESTIEQTLGDVFR